MENTPTIDRDGRAARIHLFSFSTPHMRAFHMTWLAFFLCFFAWFGIAPLMAVVREELKLTQSQIGYTIIASVAATIFARLLIGWLCDRIGPRIAYTGLLIFGSIPVMGIGLAQSFESFLIFRLMIGAIGASFVITQYHTSVMFAPNCVGTANATAAGWGNLGGGATNMLMPLLLALFVGVLGVGDFWGWRLAMLAAGAVCFLTGIAYYFLTQDSPAGNYREIRKDKETRGDGETGRGAFLLACRDARVWVLFIVYGACFGIELTINNIAALYFVDYFDVFKEMDTARAMKVAGVCAGLFGLMNLFARTLGGVFGDRCGRRWGLNGRILLLFAVLLGEGLALMLFSQMTVLILAIPALILFSLFVQMSEGATYAIVPFINPKALGSVAGIIGAGGNAGAVAAGFLFKSEIPWPSALLIVGVLVTACSFLVLFVRFAPASRDEPAQEGAVAPAV